MEKFDNYEMFTLNHHLVPTEIAIDVFKRICDWLSTGGSLEDDYVKKQLEYASRCIAKG